MVIPTLDNNRVPLKLSELECISYSSEPLGAVKEEVLKRYLLIEYFLHKYRFLSDNNTHYL